MSLTLRDCHVEAGVGVEGIFRDRLIAHFLILKSIIESKFNPRIDPEVEIVLNFQVGD